MESNQDTIQILLKELDINYKTDRYVNTTKAYETLYDISSTQQGLQKLSQHNYQLIKKLNRAISMPPYQQNKIRSGQLDEYHLKIYYNLLNNKKFIEWAVSYVDSIKKYRNHYHPKFRQSINKILDKIEIQGKKIEIQRMEQMQIQIKNNTYQGDFLNSVLNGSQKTIMQKYRIYMKYLQNKKSIADIRQQFPKGCPGCLIYNLVKWPYINHNNTESINFFTFLCGNEFPSLIINSLIGMIQKAFKKSSRSIYSIHGCACLDLKMSSKQYKIFTSIGQAIEKRDKDKSYNPIPLILVLIKKYEQQQNPPKKATDKYYLYDSD